MLQDSPVYLSAIISTFFSILLLGAGIVLIVQARRSPLQTESDKRQRISMIVSAIGMSIAILMVALPSLIYPDDANRFPRLYGILWPPIRIALSALFFFLIGIAINRSLKTNKGNS